MSSTTQSEAVRFDVTVKVSAERAFRVFTEHFDQIKPREHNLLAPEPIAETVFETRVGGHVYDRGENGSVCRWARVLAFEPPRRGKYQLRGRTQRAQSDETTGYSPPVTITVL